MRGGNKGQRGSEGSQGGLKGWLQRTLVKEAASGRQAGRAADTSVLYGWQQDTDFRSLDSVFDFSVGGWGYLL